jgi:RNA 3'-terminal phosphate cyclase (ATP)
MVETHSAALTTVFTAFGKKGTAAEEVARDAARQAKRYLQQAAPVDEHLADQLLLPMALAGGGAFVTGTLSLHSTTNIETIRRFIEVRIDVEEINRHHVLVRVGA